MEPVPALIGLGVLTLIVVVLVGLFLSRQRTLTQRVGSFGCAVRTDASTATWVDGIAQYAATELRWWRALSLVPRPARSWPRERVEIVERVVLETTDGWGRPMVRARVRVGDTSFEIELSSAAYSGLISWLEAGPRTVGTSS